MTRATISTGLQTACSAGDLGVLLARRTPPGPAKALEFWNRTAPQDSLRTEDTHTDVLSQPFRTLTFGMSSTWVMTEVNTQRLLLLGGQFQV